MRERSLISIVTACYNSEAFIERTYASVKAQTYRNVEWIVVNDGSTDGTLKKLARLCDEGLIPIVVLDLPENVGSERAIREGVWRARGQFTLILDHDDELISTALDTLTGHWEAFPSSHDRLSGVGGRCRDQNGCLVGTPLPVSPMISNELEVRHIYKVRGELAGMVRTDVLRKEFGEFERGMTHGLVWCRIARKYNAIYTDDVVRIYHTNIPTSMTRAKIRFPDGAMRACLCNLNENSDYLSRAPIFFLKETLLYAKYCLYAKKPLRQSLRQLNRPTLRAVFCICLPLIPTLVVRDWARRLL